MDHKLLLEDIKFPLSWGTEEYKMYIFDADMNMIAQVERGLDATVIKHPFEKLIGDYKQPAADYDLYKLAQGDFINTLTLEVIGEVRGWGGLQYKDRAEGRQNNIAEYILNVINS